MPNLEQRYWSKIDMSSVNGCWPWTGCASGQASLLNGEPARYGCIRVGRTMLKAHRVGWQLVYGLIPDGLSVLHSCDVRLCQRPEHWFLGTAADNAADRERKGRGLRTRTARNQGVRHGNVRLTEPQVREIRSRRAKGERVTDIATDFGMAASTVSNICRRWKWRHI